MTAADRRHRGPDCPVASLAAPAAGHPAARRRRTRGSPAGSDHGPRRCRPLGGRGVPGRRQAHGQPGRRVARVRPRALGPALEAARRRAGRGRRPGVVRPLGARRRAGARGGGGGRGEGPRAVRPPDRRGRLLRPERQPLRAAAAHRLLRLEAGHRPQAVPVARTAVRRRRRGDQRRPVRAGRPHRGPRGAAPADRALGSRSASPTPAGGGGAAAGGWTSSASPASSSSTTC